MQTEFCTRLDVRILKRVRVLRLRSYNFRTFVYALSSESKIYSSPSLSLLHMRHLVFSLPTLCCLKLERRRVRVFKMALVEALQLSYLFLLVSPEGIEPKKGHSELGLPPSLLLRPLSRC